MATETTLVEQEPNPDGCCAVFFVDRDRVERVREAMLDDDHIEQVAEMFKVIAHPTRVRILRALAAEELCVCDLSQVIGLSISAISHQLSTMRKLRLVRYRMEGKLAYYTLRNPVIMELLERGIDHFRKEDRL